jgi:hypothetical protein
MNKQCLNDFNEHSQYNKNTLMNKLAQFFIPEAQIWRRTTH